MGGRRKSALIDLWSSDEEPLLTEQYGTRRRSVSLAGRQTRLLNYHFRAVVESTRKRRFYLQKLLVVFWERQTRRAAERQLAAAVCMSHRGLVTAHMRGFATSVGAQGDEDEEEKLHLRFQFFTRRETKYLTLNLNIPGKHHGNGGIGVCLGGKPRSGGGGGVGMREQRQASGRSQRRGRRFC